MNTAAPLLGFFGDDFVGSVEALDTLAAASVPAVLFTRPPSADELARFPHVRALGIAGRTRTMTPADAEGTLRLALATFRDAGIGLVHYKVSANFESSPGVASIGRVIDVGLDALGESVAVIVPDAPLTSGDLRQRLAEQTALPIGVFNVAGAGDTPAQAGSQLNRLCATVGRGAVLLDGLTDASNAVLGQLLLASGRRLVIGASTVGAALGAALGDLVRASGGSPRQPADQVGPVVIVCGSRSQASGAQIRHAVSDGFSEVILSPNALTVGEINNAMISAVVAMTHALNQGKSVVLHTDADHCVPHSAADDARLGKTLGHTLRLALQRRNVNRVLITGSDTCSRVASAIGISAIEIVAPLTHGAPLCRVTSATPAIDGLQIVFKSGKFGAPDFFCRLRDGATNAS